MRKQAALLFSLLFFLSFISLVSAVPPEPMAFYGNISYTNGTAIPNGYYIVAKIGTAVNGECEIIGSFYGKGQDTCIIVSHSSSSSQKVEFFLGNEKLGEYNFEAREIVNLNFNVSHLPVGFTPLSNGVCELPKGECSYNVLDCDASKTNACIGNGVCDTVIGETCINAVDDCGACSSGGSGGSPPSGGGGGGGGGGSGSSSSSSSNPTQTPAGNSSDSNSNGLPDLNIQKLNENDKKNSNGGLGITGGAIGAIGNFAKTGTGIAIFIGLAAVIVFGIAITSMKKRKSAKSKNSETK